MAIARAPDNKCVKSNQKIIKREKIISNQLGISHNTK